MDPDAFGIAVDDAFERTSHGLIRWDDPHPDRRVADEEYSRVTDPAKWRIVGARVDAWIDVLVAAGLATVERDARPEWDDPPAPILTRTDEVRPAVPDALVLVVGRSRIESVDDAGIVIGVGHPTVRLAGIPDCGCDACDSGSADVISQVDTWIGGIVRGELHHLVRPNRTITVVGDAIRRSSYSPDLPSAGDGWRWTVAPDGAGVESFDAGPPSGPTARIDIEAVLADPTGWREWSGPSWFG